MSKWNRKLQKCHYFSYFWHFHSGSFLMQNLKCAYLNSVSNSFFCRFDRNVQQSCREKSLKRQTPSLIVKNPTAYVFANFFLVMCETQDPYFIFGICYIVLYTYTYTAPRSWKLFWEMWKNTDKQAKRKCVWMCRTSKKYHIKEQKNIWGWNYLKPLNLLGV